MSRRFSDVPPKMTGRKTCSRCKRTKQITEFYARHYTRDGRMQECKACSNSRKRRPNPPAIKGFKTCSECGVRKSVLDFHAAKTGEKGRHCYCKDCESLRHKKRKYGVTAEEYAILLDRAQRQCECCKMDLVDRARQYLDHCPETGRARGILCQLCNSLVGAGQPQQPRIYSAIKYLESHGIAWFFRDFCGTVAEA